VADGGNLLFGAAWQCIANPPGTTTEPHEKSAAWLDAEVPGTVASTLAAHSVEWAGADIDGQDWWYRTSFAADDGSSADIEWDGLAGFAEIWLNGRQVADVSNMFVAGRVQVTTLAEHNVLALRFRSERTELAGRHPRPRWRVARLASPHLRWARLSLWGRLQGAVPVPPAVGPWREIRVVQGTTMRLVQRRLTATPSCSGSGVVDIVAELRGAPVDDAPHVVSVRVDESVASATVEPGSQEGSWMVRARVALDAVDLWWPRTAGSQPLYEVTMTVDGVELAAGRVGFRTIAVDRSDGGFRFVMNGVPLFVGGACWMPVDPIGLGADPVALRGALQSVVDGNLTMLRVSGDTVYESDAFYNLCDELGILIWQDCMLAFSDPPADPAWESSFREEVEQNLGRLMGRPCLALVSGGSEIAQQAAYAGVEIAGGFPLLTERLPELVEGILGDIPFLPTSPWGGDIPTRPDVGVSHYYGVGAYLRGLEDSRLAEAKFAAECLAFAIPPERQSVDRAFGGPEVAGHGPDWKRAVFRDAGASWDFEDVREHYVRELFGLDLLTVRYSDPERYLDLGRATVAYLCGRVFAEWRRGRSASGGGLVFYLRDSLPGAGLGLLDSYGLPKAPWYAMRRALAPVAVTIADEGLNGLVAHLHNATADTVTGTVRIDLFVDGELLVDSAEHRVELAPRTSTELGIDDLFSGFRDLAWAHRFGPLTYDAIAIRLIEEGGSLLSDDVHLPGGLLRAVERDLGLTATVQVGDDDGSAEVTLQTRRLAQFVNIDVPGWRPVDGWFDLVPGRERTVHLERVAAGARLIGSVRSINGGVATLRVE
jgi:beta-mannosidase